MGRYKPGMRSKLIDIFFRRMQRRDTSGPVFVALGDRIAELDNLYHIALTKPDWRPSRIKPDPVEAVIPEEVDTEGEELYKKFLEEQYGGTAGDSSTSPKGDEGASEGVRPSLEQKQSSDPVAR